MIRTGGPGTALAWSRDGTTLAVVVGKTVELYGRETGEPVGDPIACENTLWWVAFAPNGRLVTAGGACRVWDRDGKEAARLTPIDYLDFRVGLTADGPGVAGERPGRNRVRVIPVANWCARRAGDERARPQAPVNPLVGGRRAGPLPDALRVRDPPVRLGAGEGPARRGRHLQDFLLRVKQKGFPALDPPEAGSATT